MVGEEGPALFLDGHRIVDGYPFCEILGVSKLPEASKIQEQDEAKRQPWECIFTHNYKMHAER